MTFEELILHYSSDTDTEQMKEITAILSDFIEKKVPYEDKETLLKKLYGVVGGGHFDKCFSDIQVSDMYYTDKDVKHYAPYWTEGELQSLFGALKDAIKPYNFYDFVVVMNMVKSDQHLKLKKWFPSATEDELLDKLVDEAVTWLNDPDNPFGETKVWSYFNR